VETGDIFKVYFKKHVIVSDTDQYWVVENDNGERFLIDFFQYKNYGFEAGKSIQVKVDKINCSGKVFLEPVHPFYEEGKKYFFEIEQIIKYNQNSISVFVVDVFGNKIAIEYHKNENEPVAKKIELLVIGLRKGLPVLLDPVLEKQTPFKENEIYSFFVADKIKITADDFFQLEDKFGRIHLLPAIFYKKYPIEIGKPLDCYIVSIEQNAVLKLEPVHPVFKLGYELELNFIGNYTGDEYIGRRHKLYLLRDDEGNEFFMSHRFMEGREIPKRINCRIEKLKKGQILVEPI
jgi:hypothetical protein